MKNPQKPDEQQCEQDDKIEPERVQDESHETGHLDARHGLCLILDPGYKAFHDFVIANDA